MYSRNHKGSTSVITLGVVALIVSALAIWVISSRNTLVRFENKVEAIDRDMQNVHASIFQQMRQQGVAVEKYGDLVIQGIHESMNGRYGADGSRAAMQWITEQNPSIDPKIMEKLQIAIESGYNRFEAVQRTKIDVVRTYKDATQVFPNNIIANMFGYPRKSWSELERIVTSSQTKADFEKGELSDPRIFDKK